VGAVGQLATCVLTLKQFQFENRLEVTGELDEAPTRKLLWKKGQPAADVPELEPA
jgi:hypothetical protein